MPRQPRLIVAGYPHHIILRGNNRNAVFYNDTDRRFFLKCLKAAKEKTKSKIYAYCLMTNHLHLLLEPSSEDGAGDLIQSLGRRYVRYINQAYKRTGTLWEGRFKSSLISRDEYLLSCARYIELNPVRAKMAGSPKDYPWSSFGFRAEGRPDELLDEDPVYKGLGATPSERQVNYKEWFKRSASEEELSSIRNAVQKGGIFGNKGFFDRVAQLKGRDVVLRPRGRPIKSL
ncbi:transposase [bacterium]|nr:MAG: transposase [bacterium]